MNGFILSGKVRDVVAVLAALAELEWEMPNLLALLDCQVISLESSVVAKGEGKQ